MVIRNPQCNIHARISPLGESTRGSLRAFCCLRILSHIRILGCVSVPSRPDMIEWGYRVWVLDVVGNLAFLFSPFRRCCGPGRVWRLSQTCGLRNCGGFSRFCGSTLGHGPSFPLQLLLMRINFAQRRYLDQTSGWNRRYLEDCSGETVYGYITN